MSEWYSDWRSREELLLYYLYKNKIKMEMSKFLSLIVGLIVGYLIGEYVEYRRLSERDRLGVKILEAIVFNNKDAIDEVIKFYEKSPKIGEDKLNNAIYEFLLNKRNSNKHK